MTLTVERLVDPQRIHLYDYCRNDPLAFVDPTGESVTYADGEAKKKYDGYEKFLNTTSRALAAKHGFINITGRSLTCGPAS